MLSSGFVCNLHNLSSSLAMNCFIFLFLLLLMIQIPPGSPIPNTFSPETPPHLSRRVPILIRETTVRVTNHESRTLTLHCKSKDTDLGVHQLSQNSFFEFKFQPNVFIMNTLFFCSFEWSDQPLKYFDIYIEKRDVKVCKFCSWNARLDGPCMELKSYSKCYPWNHE